MELRLGSFDKTTRRYHGASPTVEVTVTHSHCTALGTEHRSWTYWGFSSPVTALHVAFLIPIPEQAVHANSPSLGAKEPREQGGQVEFLPSAGEEVPAEHKEQSPDPSEAENCPARQRLESNPLDEYEPLWTI